MLLLFLASKMVFNGRVGKAQSRRTSQNKACVLEKVRSRFHLGVLVYSQTEIVAWVSLGPLPEFFWAWRRVAQLGDASKGVAIIPCLTRKTECRDDLSEAAILKLLRPYGIQQGWSAIEGYLFDRDVIDRLGDAVTWPGSPEAFAEAGFVRTGDHWLSSQEFSRSVYRMELV